MRDPSLDKDASAVTATAGELTSAKATGGDTPATLPLPSLDYEIEAMLQVPEIDNSPFGQYVKDCPVCKCAVRCYFMNFNEKVVMCESTTCSWPFGYEEPQCLKHDEALAAYEEVESLKVMTYGPILPAGSVISTVVWSEMDRSQKGLDPDEPCHTPTHRSDAERDAKLQEVLKQKDAEQQTRKNLQDIKKLNVQLQKTYEDEEEISCIRNEKWIKHLNTLQSMSGVKLLRKEEMALLKQNKAPQGITMNINKENTSITINIADPSLSEPTITKEQMVTDSTSPELTPTVSTGPESTATKSSGPEPTATKSSATESTSTESTAPESTPTESTAPESTPTESTAPETTATKSIATESSAIETISVTVSTTMELIVTEEKLTDP